MVNATNILSLWNICGVGSGLLLLWVSHVSLLESESRDHPFSRMVLHNLPCTEQVKVHATEMRYVWAGFSGGHRLSTTNIGG